MEAREAQGIHEDFGDVPVGATLEIWVRGKKAAFSPEARVEWANEDGVEEHKVFTRRQLHRKSGGDQKGTMTLSVARTHFVTFRTAFFDDEERTLEVFAQVTREDGGQTRVLEGPVFWKHTGTSMERERSFLTIRVRQA